MLFLSIFCRKASNDTRVVFDLEWRGKLLVPIPGSSLSTSSSSPEIGVGGRITCSNVGCPFQVQSTILFFSYLGVSSLCSRVTEPGGLGGLPPNSCMTFARRRFARIISSSAASCVSPPNHISVLSPLFVPFMYLAHSCCVRFLWALSKWFESLTCGFDLQPGIGPIFLKFGLATTVCLLLASPLCWTSNGSFN